MRSTIETDPWRSAVEAVRVKYAPNDGVFEDLPVQHDSKGCLPTVWISGKEVEEIGYSKINKQQAQLSELRIVVLDQMLVSSRSSAPSSLSKVCPSIVELDLSRDLIESVDDVALICSDLNGLRSVNLE